MVFFYYFGLFCHYSGLQDTIATLNIICRLHLSLLNSVRNSSIVLTSFGKYVAHTPTFPAHPNDPGTKCKISILPCICRCFHTCCKRCTSIEHLHHPDRAPQPRFSSRPALCAEMDALQNKRLLCFYKIYKILCRRSALSGNLQFQMRQCLPEE